VLFTACRLCRLINNAWQRQRKKSISFNPHQLLSLSLSLSASIYMYMCMYVCMYVFRCHRRVFSVTTALVSSATARHILYNIADVRRFIYGTLRANVYPVASIILCAIMSAERETTIILNITNTAVLTRTHAHTAR